MKFVVFIVFVGNVFNMSQLLAQTSKTNVVSKSGFSSKDSIVFNYLDTYRIQLRKPEYELYPTKNIWTLIKLNTVTGQLWQIQYSIDENPRMQVELDIQNKIGTMQDAVCGRFKLFPTENMYNFILLDQIDGRCWQVQWSTYASNRGAVRIY